MKNIVVIGTVGIPACYGGFESLVENLTKNRSEGFNYTVFCSSPSYNTKLISHNGANLIYLPLKANGIQSIFYDIYSLIKTLRLKPDTVLILGVSGCVFLPVFRKLSKAKVVTNIDGLEWKRDKWNFLAKKFLKFSETLAVKYSDSIVSDNRAIAEHVKKCYSKVSSVIAYGGDHALRGDLVEDFIDGDYALGLCRIEPENNVDMILEAFSTNGRNIKFVGNWGSSDFGLQLKEKFAKYKNIELIDPIYDLDVLYELRRKCELYVHGHSAGGTNPSLVEMMHFSKTILAFDCDFNRFSTKNKAHYFSNSLELQDVISSLTPQEKESNANYMKSIAQEEYTWGKISYSYESLY
ncbi:DUF1972 domain-containing protein [Vibrio breoganii]